MLGKRRAIETLYFVLLMLCATELCVAVGIDGEQPVMTVYPCQEPPKIDGDLNDPCWAECAPVQDFSVITGTAPSRYPTAARITYDSANLYLAVVCRSDQSPRSEQTEHDHPDLWRDDHIEVSINPTPNGPDYFHLLINTNGAWLDERITGYEPRDTSWDIELRVDVSSRPDGYTLEAAIPFAGLGAHPQPTEESSRGVGPRWGFNLCRGTHRATELSAWSHLRGTFYAPHRFGSLLFGTTGARLADVDPLPTFPGSHAVTMTFLPTSEYELAVRVLTTVERRQGGSAAADQTIRVYSEGPYPAVLPLVVPDDATSIRLEVVELPGERLIFSTGSFPLRRQPSPAIKTEPLQAALAELDAASDRTGVREVIDRGHRVLTMARELSTEQEEYFASFRPLLDQWRILVARAQRITSEARRRTIIARTRLEDVRLGRDASGYAVLVLSPMTKVERTAVPAGIVDGTVTIELARGEYESAQFTVYPFKGDLEDVTIRVNDLVHTENKAIILARDVLVHRVGFINCRPPQYEPDLVGSLPDPLLPYEPFSVPAGRHQPVWLTLHVSRVMPAGLYQGSIEISAGGRSAHTLPFVVRVYDFLLERMHLTTAFALFESEVQKWYDLQGARLPQDIRRKYYEFLLSYRLNPTNIYSSEPRPSKDDLQFCLDRGMTDFNVKHIPRGIAWTEDEKKGVLGFFDDYYPFLKENDLLDVAYCYSFDEPNSKDYPKIQEIFGLLASRYPGLRRATTEPPAEELEGYVDIYVPLTANYDETVCRARQAAGDEIWWYVCLAPKHPYANFFVDYQGIDHRIIFWQTWKYGVTGFLYYAINLWRTNVATEPTASIVPFDDTELIAKIRSGLRWPLVPWNSYTYTRHNGDGHLIYPGPNGNPLPSVRLALIRDGIEDYEYLYILQSRLDELLAKKSRSPEVLALTDEASTVLMVRENVVESLTKYTHDPAVLMTERRRVAELIERIDRKLEGG